MKTITKFLLLLAILATTLLTFRAWAQDATFYACEHERTANVWNHLSWGIQDNPAGWIETSTYFYYDSINCHCEQEVGVVDCPGHISGDYHVRIIVYKRIKEDVSLALCDGEASVDYDYDTKTRTFNSLDLDKTTILYDKSGDNPNMAQCAREYDVYFQSGSSSHFVYDSAVCFYPANGFVWTLPPSSPLIFPPTTKSKDTINVNLGRTNVQFCDSTVRYVVLYVDSANNECRAAPNQPIVCDTFTWKVFSNGFLYNQRSYHGVSGAAVEETFDTMKVPLDCERNVNNPAIKSRKYRRYGGTVVHEYTDIRCDSVYPLHLTLYSGRRTDGGVSTVCDTHFNWLQGRTLINPGVVSTNFLANDSIRKTSSGALNAEYSIYKAGTHRYEQIVLMNTGNADQDKCYDTVSLIVNVYKSHDTIIHDTFCGHADYSWNPVRTYERIAAPGQPASSSTPVTYTGAYTKAKSTWPDGLSYYGTDKSIKVDSNSAIKFYTSRGCDSTIYLYLALYKQRTSPYDTAVCKTLNVWGKHQAHYPAPISFGAGTRDTNIYDTIANQIAVSGMSHGFSPMFNFHCDSLYKLGVRVYNDSVKFVNIDSCTEASYSWWGATRHYKYYTAANAYPTTDTAIIYDTIKATLGLGKGKVRDKALGYTHHGNVTNGPMCDSSVAIQVKFHGYASATLDTNVCHSFSWRGRTYLAGIDFSKYNAQSNLGNSVDSIFPDKISGHYTVTSGLINGTPIVCDSLYFLRARQWDTVSVVTRGDCGTSTTGYNWGKEDASYSSEDGHFYYPIGTQRDTNEATAYIFTYPYDNTSLTDAELRANAPRTYNEKMHPSSDCRKITLLRLKVQRDTILHFPEDSAIATPFCDSLVWHYSPGYGYAKETHTFYYKTFDEADNGVELAAYRDYNHSVEGCDSTWHISLTKGLLAGGANFCSSDTTLHPSAYDPTHSIRGCGGFRLAENDYYGVHWACYRHSSDGSSWGAWDTVHELTDISILQGRNTDPDTLHIVSASLDQKILYPHASLFDRYFEIYDLKGTNVNGCKHFEKRYERPIVTKEVWRLEVNGCDSLLFTTANDPEYTGAPYMVRQSEVVTWSTGGVCDVNTVVRKQYVRIHKSVTDTDFVYACDSLIWGHRVGAGSEQPDYIDGSKGKKGGNRYGLYNPTTHAPISDNRIWKNNIHDYSLIDSLFSIHGCDSNVYLHLTLAHTHDSAIKNGAGLDSVVYRCTPYWDYENHPLDTPYVHWVRNNDTIISIYADTNQVIDTVVRYYYSSNDNLGLTSSVRTGADIGHCDSTLSLHFKVFGVKADTTYDTACSPFIRDFANSGTPVLISRDTLYLASIAYYIPNGAMCEHEAYFDIHIIHSSYRSYDTVVCDSLTLHTAFNDTTFGHPGMQSLEVFPKFLWQHYGNDDPSLCILKDTINIAVYHSFYDTIYDTSCYSYFWRNRTFTETNTTTGYEVRSGSLPVQSYTNPSTGQTKYIQCDSVYNLMLTIIGRDTTFIYDTACNNEYTWHSHTFTPQNYNSVTKQLTAPATFDATQHRIAGDSAYIRKPNQFGCDSLIFLMLDVHTSDTTRLVWDYHDTLICDTAVWRTYQNGVLFREHVFAHDTVTTLADTLRNTRYASVSCDSLVFLTLRMAYMSRKDTSVIACDSLFWPLDTMDANRWRVRPITSTTGKYQAGVNHYSNLYDTVNMKGWNAVGCDSVVYAHFLIVHSDSVSIALEGCDSVVYSGVAYYNTLRANELLPVHTQNFPTVIGHCDSLITTIPTVHKSFCDTLDTVHHPDPYHWTLSGWDSNLSVIPHTWEYGVRIDSNYHLDNITVPAPRPTHYLVRDTVNTVYGCDSIYHFELYIYENFYDTITMGSGPGYDLSFSCDSVEWRGKKYYESGTYYDTIRNIISHGVPGDSIYVLIADVRHDTYHDVVVVDSSCDSVTYSGHFYTYSDAVNDTVRLLPSYVTKNVQGCDSFAVKTLVIHKGDTFSEMQVTCDSFNWYSPRWVRNLDTTIGSDTCHRIHHPYRAALVHDTVVTNDYVNDKGCRSQDTLRLTLYRHDTTHITKLACKNWDTALLINPGIPYSLHYLDFHTERTIDTIYQEIDNAAGCHHYDHFKVTIFPDSIISHDTLFKCDTFKWVGATNITYHSSGTYHHNFGAVGAHGCDSIAYIHLTINHGSYEHFDTIVCDSFVYNGKNFGYTYYPARDTLHDTVRYIDPIYGCPSVDTLNVLIIPSTCKDSTVQACDAYTFSWRIGARDTSKTYTASGTYYDARNLNTQHYTGTFKGKAYDLWCNYVTRLNLTISDSIVYKDTVYACDSYTWAAGDGRTYTVANYNSDNHTMRTNAYQPFLNAGDPIATRGTSVSGCDSVHYLHLFLDTTAYTYDTVIYSDPATWTTLENPITRLCDSAEWHGRKFYRDTVLAIPDVITHVHRYDGISPNFLGNVCDSHVTLVLSLGYTTDTILDLEGCSSVFWADLKWYQETVLGFSADPSNGNFLTSQVYDAGVILPNSYGCDSILNADVKVYHDMIKDEAIVVQESACDTLLWHGRKYTQTYTVPSVKDSLYDTIPDIHGCDSIVKIQPLIKPNRHTHINPDFACGPWTWTVNHFDGSLAYTVTFPDSVNTIYDTVHVPSYLGCDSMLTLEVFVNKAYDSIQIQPQTYYCDSVRWYDTVLITTTGTYYVFLPASIPGMCDTVVYFKTVNATDDTIDVPIYPSTHNAPIVADSTCKGWLKYNGHIYTSTDTIYTNTGATDANGCPVYDQKIVLVRDSSHNVTEVLTCETYTWTDATGNWTRYDSVYTFKHSHRDNLKKDTIIKTHAYVDTNRCGGVDTLKLVLMPEDTITIDTASCGQFAWKIPIPGTNPTRYYTQASDLFSTSKDTVELFRTNTFGCNRYDSLHFVHMEADTNTVYDTACEVFSYNLQQYYEDDTIFRHVGYSAATYCDSILRLIFHVDHGSFARIDTAVCDSLVYHFPLTMHDTTFRHIDETRTEEFFDTLAYNNAFGCTSVDTLRVIIFRRSAHYDVATACAKYDWGPFTESNGNALTHSCDTSYYTTTIRHDYMKNGVPTVKYCDTTSYLHLTVNYYYDSALRPVACNTYRVPWNGTILTPSNYNTHTSKTIGNVSGANNDTIHRTVYRSTPEVCDTVISLLLTLSRDTLTNQVIDWHNPAQFSCDSMIWHDRTLYRDTILDSVFTSIYGCDSTVHLTLRLAYANDSNFGLLDSCEEVYWEPWKYYLENVQGYAANDTNGYFHHTPGTELVVRYPKTSARGSQVYRYTDPISGNLYACDSVVRATIVIRKGYYDIPVYDTACDELVWAANGLTYRENFYQVKDSLKHNVLTVAQYSGQQQCDSVIVLHPTIHYSTFDTTKLDTVVSAGSVTLHFNTFNSATKSYTTIDSTYYYSGMGTYYQVADTIHAFNQYGCDSTITVVVRLYQNGIDSTTMWEYTNHAHTYMCDTFIWTPTTSVPGHTHVITTTGYYSDTVHGVGSVAGVPTVFYDSIYVIYAEIRNTAIHDSINDMGGTVPCDSINYHGVYYYRDTTIRVVEVGGAINGCDSITNLTLRVNHQTHMTFRDTACETYSWSDISGRWIYDPATYVRNHRHEVNLTPQLDTVIHYYTNTDGCESADTLYLVLYPTDTITYDTAACIRFRWQVTDPLTGGQFACNFNTTVDRVIDSVRNDFLNIYGCTHYDSLHLVLASDKRDTVVDTACDRYEWPVNGLVYRNSVAPAATGTRIYGVAAGGCDSVYHLDLTVYHSRTGDTTVTRCNTYTWPINGKYKAANGGYRTYTASNNYVDTTKTFEGCDSVVTLHLTINARNRTTETYDTVCADEGEYAWNFVRGGHVVTTNVIVPAANTVKDTFVVWDDPANVEFECDSTAILHLFAKELRYDTVRVDTCWSFYWRDTTYTVSRIRDVHEISSIGCDSTTTLILNMDVVTGTLLDTFACDNYTWVNRGDTVDTYTEGAFVDHFDTSIAPVAPHGHYCPTVDTLRLSLRFAADHFDTLNTTACNTFLWKAFADTNIHDTTYAYMPDSVAVTKRVLHRTYAEGCDSVRWLNLALGYSQYRTDSLPNACDSIEWHGNKYYDHVLGTSAFYHTATDMYGCDTTVRLKVYVYQSQTEDLGLNQVCDSLVWSVTGHVLDTLYKADEGVVTRLADWTTTEKGCPYYYKTTLNVRESHKNIFPIADCDSHYWDATDRMYYYSTVDTFYLHRDYNAGCDSTEIMILSVGSMRGGYTDTTVCDSLLWKGVWYTTNSLESGIFVPGDTTAGAAGICDSVHYYTLHLNHTQRDTNDSIVCDVYTWNGGTPYTNDNVFVNPSLTLGGAMTVNGCDSIVYVNFQVARATRKDSVVAHACDTFAFTWFDGRVTSTTNYTAPVANDLYTHPEGDVNGCDSVLYFTLTTIDTSSTGDSATEGCNPYFWNGNIYTASAVSTITLTTPNRFGCDSLSRVAITVYDTVFTDDSIDYCATMYKWQNGRWYDTDINSSAVDAPKVKKTDIHGCDSIITLNLQLHSPVYAIYRDSVVVACDSFTWTEGDGRTYTSTTTYGSYPEHKVSLGAGKCDSTTYLALTVNHSTSHTTALSKCDQYTWHGHLYNVSGLYSDTLINAVGCDSIDLLNLTVNTGTNNTLYDTACDSYTWNGYTFNIHADSAVQHFTKWKFIAESEECKHTDTLYLTMYRSMGIHTVDSACSSYSWSRGAHVYTTLYASGTHYHTYDSPNGCRSTDTLDLTLLDLSENYYDVHACDIFTWSRVWDGDTLYTANTITSRPEGYVKTYRVNRGSYTCWCRDTFFLTIGRTTPLPTNISAMSCLRYDWWSEDGTEHAGYYTSSGTYAHTFTNASGCDSTVQLTLTVRRGDTVRIDTTVCDLFTYDSRDYDFSTNFINAYLDASGCVGVDSVFLTVNKSRNVTFDTTVCDFFYWNQTGVTYDNSITVVDSISTVAGCDSVVTMHLTVNYNSGSKDTFDVCDSIRWHGTTYTTTGNYGITYTNASGCVATDSLFLTVRSNENLRIDTTICDEYVWHDASYTTSGVYRYNYMATNGCASTDTLYLTVNKSTQTVDFQNACDSLVWRNGKTYYFSSTNNSQTDTLTTSSGCDSIIYLNLTVSHSTETQTLDTVQACDIYNWPVKTGYMTPQGFIQTGNKVNTYTESGIYKTPFCKNVAGCDSLRVLDLTLGHKDTVEATMDACGTYTFYGATYTNRTQADSVFTLSYTENRNYQNGCDSTTILLLTLHPIKNQNAPVYRTACDSFAWNGHTYRTSGIYDYYGATSFGCDSVVMLNLVLNYSNRDDIRFDTVCDIITWGRQVLTESGSYHDTLSTREGCDSIRTLHLTVFHSGNYSTSETVCDYKVWPNDLFTDTLRSSMTVWRTTYPELYGCRRVDTLHLTVNRSTITRFDSVACDSIRWYSNTNPAGAYYSATGTYTYTAHQRNAVGCDSSLVMKLIVHPSLFKANTIRSCNSITWHGTQYTTTQTAVYAYDSLYADGISCRVVDTLHFIWVGNGVSSESHAEVACDSYTWQRNGQTYTRDTVLRDTIRNRFGCDSSISTLVLTINNSTYVNTEITSCNSPIFWNDTLRTVSGTYTMRSTNSTGDCDSVLVLHFNTSYRDTMRVEACETYSWRGRTYTAAGLTTAVDSSLSAGGCDSNYYLLVNIMRAQRDTFVVSEHGTSYTWGFNGETYTRPGTYVDTTNFSIAYNCGYIYTLVLQLTDIPMPEIVANAAHTLIMLNHYPNGEDGDRIDYERYRWYKDGVLQEAYTGDTYNKRDWSSLDGHIYVLEVLYDNMWLRSNVIDLRNGSTGIEEVENTVDFTAYPNPIMSGRTLTVVLEGEDIIAEGATLAFFDLQGRNVLQTEMHSERATIEVALPAGVYSIRVTTVDGRKAVKKLIVR